VIARQLLDISDTDPKQLGEEDRIYTIHLKAAAANDGIIFVGGKEGQFYELAVGEEVEFMDIPSNVYVLATGTTKNLGIMITQ